MSVSKKDFQLFADSIGEYSRDENKRIDLWLFTSNLFSQMSANFDAVRYKYAIIHSFLRWIETEEVEMFGFTAYVTKEHFDPKLVSKDSACAWYKLCYNDNQEKYHLTPMDKADPYGWQKGAVIFIEKQKFMDEKIALNESLESQKLSKNEAKRINKVLGLELTI